MCSGSCSIVLSLGGKQDTAVGDLATVYNVKFDVKNVPMTVARIRVQKKLLQPHLRRLNGTIGLKDFRAMCLQSTTLQMLKRNWMLLFLRRHLVIGSSEPVEKAVTEALLGHSESKRQQDHVNDGAETPRMQALERRLSFAPAGPLAMNTRPEERGRYEEVMDGFRTPVQKKRAQE